MKLTAAVAQTASVLLDTPATVERTLALMAQAAAQGAQLIVFPEACGLSHLPRRAHTAGPCRVQTLF
jgi:predicted amidohydrolase